MEEARASLNFFGITRKGWNVQFTLRDDDEMALMERFAAFVVKLEEVQHVVPKPVGNQPISAPQKQQEAPGQAQTPPPTSSVPPLAAVAPEGFVVSAQPNGSPRGAM